ncbi:hypothetical protein M407DRAFT_244504 [Tulasnella calospora MUT 4182]|uniref:Uncharacterized protein n=1 Tax=Tulasnella calospora MUT 4182 TaxID=1051891 RepID=A0A0C3KSF6_9AGAM|nr:hypothetical protein M407DRAFT_244504 [Tulasnella calospora MUT 4182]
MTVSGVQALVWPRASSTPATTNKPGSFHSKVVLTATIGGVLILACTALFCSFKVSRYIQSRREKARLRGLLEGNGNNQHRKGKNAWDILEDEGIPA